MIEKFSPRVDFCLFCRVVQLAKISFHVHYSGPSNPRGHYFWHLQQKGQLVAAFTCCSSKIRWVKFCYTHIGWYLVWRNISAIPQCLLYQNFSLPRFPTMRYRAIWLYLQRHKNQLLQNVGSSKAGHTCALPGQNLLQQADFLVYFIFYCQRLSHPQPNPRSILSI